MRRREFYRIRGSADGCGASRGEPQPGVLASRLEPWRGGLGGSGGLLEAGLELAAYSLSPETAGNIDGGSFAITQQAESVETSFDLSDGWPTDDYLESRGVRGEDEDWYAVAEIAVAQGNTVLSEHRLLVDDVWICTR